MRSGAFLLGLMLLASLGCAAVAEEAPKITLEAKSMAFDQAVAEVAKQAGVKIMCEPGLTGTVTGQFVSMELEKVLDTLSTPSGLKWQKVYVPVQPDQAPTFAQVKARADAVAAVTAAPVVVYDPATGKQRVFVEQDPAAPSVAPDKLGLSAVYLIWKPKVETQTDTQASKDNLTKFQSLQDQRTQLLAQMTPEQRVAAYQQEMIYRINLDPTIRQQMMIDEMNARRSMDPQTHERYHQMMRDTWRSMREQGLVPDDDRRGARDRRGGDRGGGGG